VYHTSPSLQEGFETVMLTRIWAVTCSEINELEVGGTARPIATR